MYKLQNSRQQKHILLLQRVQLVCTRGIHPKGQGSQVSRRSQATRGGQAQRAYASKRRHSPGSRRKLRQWAERRKCSRWLPPGGPGQQQAG